MKSKVFLGFAIFWFSVIGACGNPPVLTQPLSLASPTPDTQAVETAPPLVVAEGTDPVMFGDASFIFITSPVEEAALAAADFDSDGHIDLVSAGEPQLTILRGDGQGGLTNFSRAPGGENPVDLALSDLDEDGDIDIVVANHGTDNLTILLRDGRGNFKPAPDSPLKINVQPHPHTVRVADLDTDGNMELVVDHRQGRGLLIMRGLGLGEFVASGLLV